MKKNKSLENKVKKPNWLKRALIAGAVGIALLGYGGYRVHKDILNKLPRGGGYGFNSPLGGIPLITPIEGVDKDYPTSLDAEGVDKDYPTSLDAEGVDKDYPTSLDAEGVDKDYPISLDKIKDK